MSCLRCWPAFSWRSRWMPIRQKARDRRTPSPRLDLDQGGNLGNRALWAGLIPKHFSCLAVSLPGLLFRLETDANKRCRSSRGTAAFNALFRKPFQNPNSRSSAAVLRPRQHSPDKRELSRFAAATGLARSPHSQPESARKAPR